MKKVKHGGLSPYGLNMEDDLFMRVKVLSSTLEYRAFMDSFNTPMFYDPQLYRDLDLEDDITLTFGYRGCKVRFPIVLLCSLSTKLHILVTTKPRRGLNINFKSETGYPFWWLRNFLEHGTPLDGVEGTAQVMLMAHKFGLDGLVGMTYRKLSRSLRLENFPYVFNAAVETDSTLLLSQCHNMISAWSDEILTLPNLSELSKEAILQIFSYAWFSPSSELNVFKAIINWWTNCGKKTYEELSFLDDVRSCFEKVRFLVMTEDDWNNHVLPCGAFPYEDIKVMLEIIRGEREQGPGLVYHVNNPKLQSTPRPKLIKTARLGLPLKSLKSLNLQECGVDDRELAWFTVDKDTCIRRVSSLTVLDKGHGKLTVKNTFGFQITEEWVNGSCTFENPIDMKPYVPYSFIYRSDSALIDEDTKYEAQRTVGGVIFEGLLFTRCFNVEFFSRAGWRFQCMSSSWDSTFSPMSSSDGTDSIEIIQRNEAEKAEENSKATQEKSKEQGSDRQNGAAGLHAVTEEGLQMHSPDDLQECIMEVKGLYLND